MVTEDGRRVGVRVVPFRCTPFLTLLDLDNHPWTFTRKSLPPTTNSWVNAVADFTAQERDYHWDTPRYRDLCIEGGLDPDYHRPRFREDHADTGNALVEALCTHTQWPSYPALNIVFDFVDVLRIDRWRHRVDVQDLQAMVRYDNEHQSHVVREAIAMIERMLGKPIPSLASLLETSEPAA